jgi:hypothetical protein
MGSIHAGSPENERYIRTYKVIRKLGLASTLDIQKHTNDLSVHSTISEMRKAGYPISPAIYVGKRNNRKIYAYELLVK